MAIRIQIVDIALRTLKRDEQWSSMFESCLEYSVEIYFFES